MPIEINELRDYKGGDPERYRHFQKARFRPVEWVDDVLAVDQEWRDLVVKRDSVRRDINKLQKEVLLKGCLVRVQAGWWGGGGI